MEDSRLCLPSACAVAEVKLMKASNKHNRQSHFDVLFRDGLKLSMVQASKYRQIEDGDREKIQVGHGNIQYGEY